MHKHRKDLHVYAFLAYMNAYPPWSCPSRVALGMRVALWESCLLRAIALRPCLLRVAWGGVCRALCLYPSCIWGSLRRMSRLELVRTLEAPGRLS